MLAASRACRPGVAPGLAPAESLISTLSDDNVEITSNFTGEQIVVFGAVRGMPEREPDYQVAVVVQGPSEDVVVRRKGRVLGIWANRASREFDARAVLLRHAPQREFRRALTPADLVHTGSACRASRFRAAGERRRRRRALRQRAGRPEERARPLCRAQERGRIPCPERLPHDLLPAERHSDRRISVSVYLFRRTSFLAGQTQMLNIEKGGFSERIARAAADEPLAYGLACVALAVFTRMVRRGDLQPAVTRGPSAAEHDLQEPGRGDSNSCRGNRASIVNPA